MNLRILATKVLLALVSSLVAITMRLSPALAHEVVPAIADMTAENGRINFRVAANVESFVAGIDLTGLDDTNASPLAADYDTLRALPPAEIEAKFRAFWPSMAERITITVDGARIKPELDEVAIPPVGDVELTRESVFLFSAPMPDDAETVEVGWDAAFGTLVLRQMEVEKPYDGYLEAGTVSPPIALKGGGQAGPFAAFLSYIPVGFDHIVPKGLDHILFVLGLFFLSTRAKPLLWQVTAFTLAHTVTLALSSLGYVSVPARIVEPLIALSIVYVAIENIYSDRLSRTRPLVVFGFGLLHGLGFASVLGEFGLPEDAFVPALIGFNIGVELGQLTVIAAAALLCWTWAARQSWYRQAVSIPASVAIALVASYWVYERTLA
jgi:hypothetical protein